MRIPAVCCVVLTTLGASTALAQSLSLTPQTLAGAWVSEGQKCGAQTPVILYLPDGRAYSTLTPKGFAGGGFYKIKGRILSDSYKTEPAFRRGSPYENQYLTETRLVVRITQNRIDFNFPGNKNPDLTTPSYRRCPEQPGVEPWFPNLKYKGFASERAKIPQAK
jgi:hypothetical protein